MAGVVTSEDQSVRLGRRRATDRWSAADAPANHIDWVLVGAAVLLSLLGLVFIYSATFHRLEEQGLERTLYVSQQLVALIVGGVGMVVMCLPDYRQFRAWSVPAYLGTLVLLAVPLFYGEPVNGSRAWIQLGGLQFQPAELAKVTLIVLLAAIFHERKEATLGLRALVEGLAVAALPMLVILLQPDFGTFLVFVAIVFGVLLLARVRVRYIVALACIGLLAFGAILASDALADYQRDRLTAFVNPDAADPEGSAFNVNQAQIAVGSGQLLGQGLFQGTQTTLNYVPANQTDFIFTVVGEETGFAGSLVLISLFGVLLWRALRIASLSRDTLGTLLAGGVVAVLCFQIFINVGMAVGIMPVTGLPLPFVSYGGTSLIGSFLMIGLLQNVHMRRFG